MDAKITECDSEYKCNFLQDSIEGFYKDTVKYVLDLFRNTINMVNEAIIG
jgi:hypothetical protein